MARIVEDIPLEEYDRDDFQVQEEYQESSFHEADLENIPDYELSDLMPKEYRKSAKKEININGKFYDAASEGLFESRVKDYLSFLKKDKSNSGKIHKSVRFFVDKDGNLFITDNEKDFKPLSYGKSGNNYYVTNSLKSRLGADLFDKLGFRLVKSKDQTYPKQLVVDLPDRPSTSEVVTAADRVVQDYTARQRDINRAIDANSDSIENMLTIRLATLKNLLTRFQERENEVRDLNAKLRQDITNAEKERSLERLSDLQNELAVTKNEIRLHTEAVAQTLDSNKPLFDRIRRIFTRNGITLLAVSAALSLIISVVIGSIASSFSSGGAVGPAGPQGPAGAQGPAGPQGPAGSSRTSIDEIKDWTVDKLKKIAELLKKLAIKIAAAIPGFIGSLLSWILNTAADIFTFLAGHLWVLLIAGLGAAFTILQNKLLLLPRSKRRRSNSSAHRARK
jgi:hypothetical protein